MTGEQWLMHPPFTSQFNMCSSKSSTYLPVDAVSPNLSQLAACHGEVTHYPKFLVFSLCCYAAIQCA